MSNDTNIRSAPAHGHQQEAFYNALATCNPQQLQAIHKIDGPVLVIAGPGTGKTQILSLRIGKILLDTDAKPHNILCLTFTDAGTVAMRNRLEQFIGADAYRVHIHTFHSFCNKVIRENMEYFSVRELELVSDLEMIDIMTTLIDGFGTDHPLKKYAGDIYSSLARLRSLFNTMKSEDWSSNLVSMAVDAYIDSLPERDEYIYKVTSVAKGTKAGEPKYKAIEAETEKMMALRAAALEFDNYEALLKKKNRYDYQDMINWVIRAFEQHEELLAKYQEEYLYFLVDEFQDTNGSQSTILHQLTEYWDNPNVFVVGDDDQSIYRFQGANLRNIEDFVTKYASALEIVMLKENYRSTQQILDASASVVVNNEERITNHNVLRARFEELEKKLVARNAKYFSIDIPVAIVAYPNVLQEEADIVWQIEKLWNAGVNLDEVAIIYRNHRHIANITKVFDHLRIPYNTRHKVNVLSLPFAQNILTILRYIEAETAMSGSGEYLLFQIMHFDYFKISPRDVATIAVACHKRDLPLQWRELMASKERMFKLNLETAGAISSLEANLNFWIKEHYNFTLQVLFEKILTRGGIFDYILAHEDKIWLLEAVNSLFEFIKDESARQPRLTLTDLIEIIDMMERNNVSIDLLRIVKADQGVHLITAHSSKGLEFDHVFIINAVASQWEKKSGANNDFRLPDTITRSVAENKIEEERRLFYVGMTRAKTHLHISFAEQDIKGKPQAKSLFVSEIENTTHQEVTNKEVSTEVLSGYTLQTLADRPHLDSKSIETAYINDKLKTYRLSVTHLSKYLRCPLTFYFENILQVPTARSPSMGFGNAIHFALEQLFKKMKENNGEQFPTADEFVEFYKKGLYHAASHFTEKEFKLRVEYGKELLPEYHQFYADKWHKYVVVEYRPGNVSMGKIPLSGALDKIEFITSDQVNVVDYKTGDPGNIKKKLKRPIANTDPETGTFEDVHGGDYWRQIVFYKILLEFDKTKNWNMASGEIDFVERRNSPTFIKEKVVVTYEDFEIVKNQIRFAYDGIMNHRFEGCGKEDCQWCEFVRNNYATDIAIEDD